MIFYTDKLTTCIVYNDNSIKSTLTHTATITGTINEQKRNTPKLSQCPEVKKTILYLDNPAPTIDGAIAMKNMIKTFAMQITLL